MYPSDATYHVLACALQHPTVDRVDLAAKYCGLQFDEDVAAAAKDADSSVPAEIRGRGKVKDYFWTTEVLEKYNEGQRVLKRALLSFSGRGSSFGGLDLRPSYCGVELGWMLDRFSSVPAEIRGRGPEAERAFQKAMKSGKVKVYRGRIMLLGQDRAGKTSLKKSLLGLPFDPEEESTVGVKVDMSKCELEVDEVRNWMPSKREMSEFEEELARLIVMDLRETEADDNDSTATDPNAEEVKV